MPEQDPSLPLAAAERYAQACRPLLRAQALEGASTACAEAGDGRKAQAARADATRAYASLGASADVTRTEAALAAAGDPTWQAATTR